MWGGAILASAYKQGIGVAFKQPVSIIVFIHTSRVPVEGQSSVCVICMKHRAGDSVFAIVLGVFCV